MRGHKSTDTQKAAACVAQAARMIVKNAAGKGWKRWYEKYKASGCTQAQSVELATNAAAFVGLKNLVASNITIHQKDSLLAVSQILRENRLRYLPKNVRRLSAKISAGLAGRSVLEIVRLPRQGNQNAVRLKSMLNQSKQKNGEWRNNPRR